MEVRLLALYGGLGTGGFQAGAVAAMAASGARWQCVCGGGAGAVNGLLVAGGFLEDMARLWTDQAQLGVPILASLPDAAAAAAAAAVPGAWAVVDPRSVSGLVAMDAVAELVEPFTARLAARLASSGTMLRVAVLCLAHGDAWLADPTRDVPPDRVAHLVAAAAATPVACRPVMLAVAPDGGSPGLERPLVDGSSTLVHPLGAAVETARQAGLQVGTVDVVLAVPRPQGEGPFAPLGLAEVAARADAARLAAAVVADAAELEQAGVTVRLLRPDSASWREFTGRADAEVALEFPTTTTRNGSLLDLTLEFGAWFVTSMKATRARD